MEKSAAILFLLLLPRSVEDGVVEGETIAAVEDWPALALDTEKAPADDAPDEGREEDSGMDATDMVELSFENRGAIPSGVKADGTAEHKGQFSTWRHFR